MYILDCIEQIRRLLHERGACEIPQFPQALAHLWYHPDILLAAHGKKPGHCFCFQTFWRPGSGALTPEINSLPALLWHLNCTESEITEQIIDFISDLHCSLTGSNEASGFSLIADNGNPQDFRSDRGCRWQLKYNGVGCGFVSLHSEFFCRPLQQPATFLLLDLSKFAALLNHKNTAQSSPDWSQNVSTNDLLALRAWRFNSSDNLASLLSENFTDPELELCRLLALINAESLATAPDLVMLQKLAESIGTTLQHLAFSTESDKMVKADV